MRNELSKKTLIPLIGPSSVGKTTIMRAVAESHPEFYRSSGFTTRPRRSDEPADVYRFLDNSDAYRRQIMEQFQLGELVQFAVHPTTDFMYGTNLNDYKGKYNLIDILSSEVAGFQSLGFASCTTAMIVVTPEQWQYRFDSNNFSLDEARKRVDEGLSSLQWGFEQHGAVRWIDNPDGKMSETVDHILAIANNQVHGNDQTALEVGEELHRHLAKLLLKLA